MMGYIVDLTVILDAIFCKTSGDISPPDVLSAMESSGNKNKIHDHIRSFVTEAFAAGSQSDVILEKITDLIRTFCVPPAGAS